VKLQSLNYGAFSGIIKEAIRKVYKNNKISENKKQQLTGIL
jgi:hypothetical protein